MNFSSMVRNYREGAARAGHGRTLSQFLYDATNKLLHIRRFDVIHLTRDMLTPLDPAKYTGIASWLATEDELLRMKAEGTWHIGDELLMGFRAGDRCLLSSVNGKLAGYTWVHTAGRPRLIPGLRISIPEQYLYNFAGFTLPEFRGYGLQPYRHHQLLERSEWRDKVGLMGYVDATNWSSKKGQSKSGYQKLGTLTMLGAKHGYFVIISRTLRRMGIQRLPNNS